MLFNHSITHPVLSIAILNKDAGILPILSDSQKFERKESIFSHDNKIGEQPGHSLHHTTLKIRCTNYSTVDKFVMLGITRFPFHDVALGFLIGKGYGRNLIVGVCV